MNFIFSVAITAFTILSCSSNSQDNNAETITNTSRGMNDSMSLMRSDTSAIKTDSMQHPGNDAIDTLKQKKSPLTTLLLTNNIFSFFKNHTL